VELTNVFFEFKIGVQEDDALNAGVEDFKETNGEKKERVAVIGGRTTGEMALHLGHKLVHFFRQLIGVHRLELVVYVQISALGENFLGNSLTFIVSNDVEVDVDLSVSEERADA